MREISRKLGVTHVTLHRLMSGNDITTRNLETITRALQRDADRQRKRDARKS